jgi:hypothetical protein
MRLIFESVDWVKPMVSLMWADLILPTGLSRGKGWVRRSLSSLPGALELGHRSPALRQTRTGTYTVGSSGSPAASSL